jgi:hypothetical protein
MSIVTADQETARSKLYRQPFLLQHTLADHPLFALPRLVELAQSLPLDRFEYNSGKLQPGTRPEDVPRIDMPVEDVIRRIETASAWMVIKFVNEDPAYNDLLRNFVEEAICLAGKSPGDYADLQGFIFVSSANSTTPFHVDAEENVLIQIRGDKFVHIFDNGDRSLIPEEAMEISPSKHRNQHYEPSFEQRAEVFALKPGEAVHIPYMAPHWVKTGDSYSISMAMTWKTREVVRLNKIRLMNGTLRHFGLPQKPPGHNALADSAKVAVHNGVRAVLDPLRKSATLRRVLRGAIYGRRANYYLENVRKTGM